MLNNIYLGYMSLSLREMNGYSHAPTVDGTETEILSKIDVQNWRTTESFANP